jgi:hypothetical protein
VWRCADSATTKVFDDGTDLGGCALPAAGVVVLAAQICEHAVSLEVDETESPDPGAYETAS